MAYTLDVKKLLKDIRGPKGVSALTEELSKVNAEVKKIRTAVQPQAEAKLKEAKATIHEIQKKLKEAHVDLDKEIKNTVSLVTKYGKEAEKQFNKIKKVVSTKKVTTMSTKPAEKAKRKATKKATSTKRKATV